MMKKDSINFYAMSDEGILSAMGSFVQHTRLQQNQTQQQVADAAGLNRATVRQIEQGNGGTILSLLQILRVLDQLSVLNNFEIEQKVSPLLLAEMERKQRKRARNANSISW